MVLARETGIQQTAIYKSGKNFGPVRYIQREKYTSTKYDAIDYIQYIRECVREQESEKGLEEVSENG